MRRRARRLGFGLATVLGLRPLGFFIPSRHAAQARPGSYPALAPLFEAADARFEELFEAIEGFAPQFARILAGEGPARFDQDWFPRLDAAAAYALVRREQPRRIVEIGSGHSTRFLARAVRDGGLPTRIVAIDPAPRADLAGLGVTHERRLLAEADPALADLGASDILFVDSSHVAMPGSDVDRIVGDVLPRLPAGTLVHWHDILLPDPYPEEWSWRGYNESIPVAALIGGGGWDLVFASHWIATRRPDRLSQGILSRLPLVPGARETSLWLRRR
ncbi:class I SAM-dependent methyltransferase [Enterovirga sp.]|uniref:class I SAM-dependent methyltransferase n=1 Tax=Enterovirga sp. TaxID=2026350 RepID=UPI002B544352|nr:class I SAM-dependent methyltransferase [Enterovirga sp.]HMO30649.1 class I SAM-dependent methyltransferase [Enterovirga sp.]